MKRTPKPPPVPCEGCNVPTRDLVATMTMNGVNLKVCEACARFMELTGAKRAAQGQATLF